MVVAAAVVVDALLCVIRHSRSIFIIINILIVRVRIRILIRIFVVVLLLFLFLHHYVLFIRLYIITVLFVRSVSFRSGRRQR